MKQYALYIKKYNKNNNNNNNENERKVKEEEGNFFFGRETKSVERENFKFFYFFLRFFLRSTKIGPQVFVGAEGKVDLRDKSYAWTLKSWSFNKLREVEVLSYLSYTLFKCFVDN